MKLLEAIADLTSQKVTQADIAAEAMCSQGLISQLVTGRIKDVRHSVGRRIFEMHARVMADAAHSQKAA